MTTQTSPLRSAIVVSCAVLIGAGSLWLHLTRQRGEPSFIAGTLPACDSPYTRKLLRQTIEQAPASLAVGLQVLRLGFVRHHLDGVRDTSQLPVRVCEAEVFANAGRRTLGFSLEWTSAKKNEVWLAVPQLPW